MDEFGGARLDGISSISNAVRKKRTQTSRRPRPDSQPFSESRSPLSSSPSDDASKVSSDENNGSFPASKRKKFNLNQCASRVSSTIRAQGETPHKKQKEDAGFNAFSGNEQGRSGSNNKRSSEGVLAPANWKSTSKVKEGFELQGKTRDMYSGRNGESQMQSGVISDGLGNDNKVKKVKLRVGGVTRTIHANSTSNGAPGGGSSTKASRPSDAVRPRPKLILQDDSDEEHSPPPDKKTGLQGIPWKNFSSNGLTLGKEDSLMGKMSGKSNSGKQADKSEPVRKSRRVPKRSALDGAFDDGDEDDEIRYLKKLKTSRLTSAYKDEDDESSKKQQKLSRVSKTGAVDENSEDKGSSRSGKDGKKKGGSEMVSEDTDYEEGEELASDNELESRKTKPRREAIDSLMDSKREMALTTRQRALQSGKDAASPGATAIEFPNGLPPPPSRKQKEKLSEVEQQVKKAEAAQRRRMQNEKAARESEAEAIRKILGQDSSRKKREDKIKKRQEELAQEKAANALMLASSTIRLIMGPNGNVVTFPNDLGFPSIFESKPYSYPPPRETCAGPTCTNPYKYRDSKSKLPLCSLSCYKAIHEKMPAETTTS